MDKDNINLQIAEIFKNIFDDDSLLVSRKTTAEHIQSWDSLNHINLMSAIEREFNISFTLSEINEMKNVGEMIDLIYELTDE